MEILNSAAIQGANTRILDSTLYNELLHCCGSKKWVNLMLSKFPIQDLDHWYTAANEVEMEMTEEDWKEAFAAHPMIGAKHKIKDDEAMEQKSMKSAAVEVLERLQDLNEQYYSKNGFIYIICATGKSSEEMLETLEARILNDTEKEVKIAAIEQSKISKLRMAKLLNRLSSLTGKL